jgi:hypothetical protein
MDYSNQPIPIAFDIENHHIAATFHFNCISMRIDGADLIDIRPFGSLDREQPVHQRLTGIRVRVGKFPNGSSSYHMHELSQYVIAGPSSQAEYDKM